MPATATGRGAQVILTGQVRRAARGSAANTLVENSRIKADLERAGLISDGSIPDGRTYTGGPAHDVFVVAPEAELDASVSTITVPAGGSIQAAHDALPATGGTILLTANTTYDITATVLISKPNVRMSAPSWNTVLKRNASFTASPVIRVPGDRCMISGFTIDGNAVNAADFELRTDGADILVERMQIINSAGAGHLGLRGARNRVTGCTISGLGIDLGTERGYGVWALTGATVTIDHNTISGTGIDGIGVDGDGSRVVGNRVFGCHCYVGRLGGQIAVYPLDGAQGFGNGVTVVGNTVGTGGSSVSSGIEIDGPNALVVGNYVDSQQSYGMVLTSSGTNVTGNVVRNSPTAFSGEAIYPTINATNFVISGNKLFDDRTTPIMRTGIWVDGATADNYSIVGNTITGATLRAINDTSPGRHKTIAHNTGFDDVIPSVASAATLVLPLNAVVLLTGSATITAITAAGHAIGRSVIIIPTGTASFVGGAGGIANSVTCIANIPLQATFDGTNWFIEPPGAPFTGGTVTGATTFSAAGTAVTVTNAVLAGGPLTVTGGQASFGAASLAAAQNVYLQSAAGFNRYINILSGGGGTAWRWTLGANATAEGGSNAGSDFFIVRFTDAGAPIDTILSITRSTGQMTLAQALRVNGNVGFNNTTPIAKPTVSGAKGSNAALASLITALAAYGLITDTTTA